MARPSTYIALVLVAAAVVVAVVTHRDTPVQGDASTVGGLAKEGHWNEDAWPEQSPLLGKPMPPLTLRNWIGTEITREGMKDKIVVLDFWATWCPPCRAAVPHNNDIAGKYAGRGVLLIGACGGGGEEKMPEVAKADKIGYPVAVTTADTLAAWHVTWFPTYAIVGRHGNVRALGIKPDYVEPILDALLNEAAASRPAATSPTIRP